jgi:hypothetical protein
MKCETTTIPLVLVAALAAAAILSSLVILVPHASAQNNPCEQTGKKNPNCFQPRLCNDPTACLIFEPGRAGNK